MTALTARAWYIYAVLPHGAPLPHCETAILPGASLALLAAPPTQDSETPLAALASLVPSALFAPDDPASRAADPDWIAARATAHHRVVAALAAESPCLPLGFGTLFKTSERVLHWLAAHDAGLRQALREVAGRAEWSLTLHEDAERHADWLQRNDPRLRDLGDAAAAAGPGTSFLLQRRAARAREAARDTHGDDIATTIAAHLAALPVRVRAEPPPASAIASWSLLAAARETIDTSLATLAASVADTGLSLRVTGPWPPYAFARAAWQEPAHA